MLIDGRYVSGEQSTCNQQRAGDAGGLKVATVAGRGVVRRQPQRRGTVPLPDVPLVQIPAQSWEPACRLSCWQATYTKKQLLINRNLSLVGVCSKLLSRQTENKLFAILARLHHAKPGYAPAASTSANCVRGP